MIGLLGASSGRRRPMSQSHEVEADVYRWCMGRTNIELDDALVAEVMRRYGFPTKRAAVDFALRRLAGPPLTTEFLQSLEGVGWDGDLDEMRAGRSPEASLGDA